MRKCPECGVDIIFTQFGNYHNCIAEQEKNKDNVSSISLKSGRTSYTKEFMENMKKADIEVVRFHQITENLLKRFLNKNKGNMEEILIVMQKGRKVKNVRNNN